VWLPYPPAQVESSRMTIGEWKGRGGGARGGVTAIPAGNIVACCGAGGGDPGTCQGGRAPVKRKPQQGKPWARVRVVGIPPESGHDVVGGDDHARFALLSLAVRWGKGGREAGRAKGSLQSLSKYEIHTTVLHSTEAKKRNKE
jgi:hypothetical protein